MRNNFSKFLEFIGALTLFYIIGDNFNQLLVYIILPIGLLGVFIFLFFKFVMTGNSYYFLLGSASAFLFTYLTAVLIGKIFGIEKDFSWASYAIAFIFVIVMGWARVVYKRLTKS